MTSHLEGRRIALVVGALVRGGAERQALLLARQLRDVYGARPEIVGLSRPSTLIGDCEAGGVPWRFVSVERRSVLPDLGRFISLMRRDKWDAILSYYRTANLTCGLTWRAIGARTFVWGQRDAGEDLIGGLGELSAVRSTPFFVSNSHHGLVPLVERLGVRPGSTRVVPNGIALEPPTIDRQEMRRRFRLPDTAFVATMVGHLTRTKDHATLLRAFHSLATRFGPETPHLVLAGRHDETYPELRRLARELSITKWVHFAGEVDEVSSLLGAVDLCVLSSAAEGISNAMLEGMAAGLPIVATDVEGCREGLGRLAPGQLVPLGNHEALADRIAELMFDPTRRAALGAANQKHVQRLYAPDRMAASMADVLKELLPKPSRTSSSLVSVPERVVMGVRGRSFLHCARLLGRRYPSLLSAYRERLERGLETHDRTASLREILLWALRTVPYYRTAVGDHIDEADITADPASALQAFPILTKAIIRREFESLKSTDVSTRHHKRSTSGGSTGEPICLIQDREFDESSIAIGHLYHELLGHAFGSPEIHIRGSARDIQLGTVDPRARVVAQWTKTRFLNAFRMTPQQMSNFASVLSSGPPSFVVAYATAAYELARYIKREGLRLRPQKALVSTAGTLHEFMRAEMEDVYQCPVYNHYGSREVSGIACERPDRNGFWMAPWGNHVEILDDANAAVADGETGNIHVTCLMNRAMPLIRYAIGDRGAWATGETGRVLAEVTGRTVDAFRTRGGTIVDGEYFSHLLSFKDWVERFQIVQQDYDRIVARIVLRGAEPSRPDIDEIASRVRQVMGPDCLINFEFPNQIPELPSGKYRYTVSEIAG